MWHGYLMLRRLLPLLLLLCLSAAPPTTPPIIKGLAQLDWGHNSDRALLNVEQWYAWNSTLCAGDVTHCTPMNRNWTLPQTACYPTLLLGNEPTNPEPAGHPITPTLAASVTVSIERACPQMRLVVANIHLNNGDGAADRQWVRDYLSAYAVKAGRPFTHTLGVHCYSGGGQWCLNKIISVTAIYTGSLWVTEAGIYSAGQLSIFLKGLPLVGRVERLYLWTNRDSSDPNHFLDLVAANGTLTALGQVYAAWVPPTVRRVWLPVASDRMAQGYP